MDHDITPRLELSHSAEPTTTRPQPRSSSPGPSDPRVATARSLSGSPGSIQAFPVFPLPPSGPSTGPPAPATHMDDYERPSSDSRSSPPLPPLPGATTGSMPLLTSDQGVWGSNTMNQRSMGPNPNPYGVPRMSTMEMLGQSKPMSMDRGVSMTRRSTIDWVVPTVEDKVVSPRQRTVGERLEPTLLLAITEKDKYARKAKLTGWVLNVAIGLQVLLGSLTTGLSAVTSGRSTQVTTAILGGLSTVVASYLARSRGSNEPELSIARVKDLEHFVRECEAFKMDYGHVLGHEHDQRLEQFRERFEELLGNGNSERKLSTPV